MTTALNVAKFFIELGAAHAEEETGDAMTNLRLNKLLYFSQGYTLARLGHTLFSDRIEAWDKGPVIPSVYFNYRSFKANPLKDKPFDRETISSDEFDLLFDVYRDMEKYSTTALINKTHEPGTPWRNVYIERQNMEIPVDLIKNYFIEHLPPKRELNPRIKIYRPLYRMEDGTPVFPKEAAYDKS